MRLAKGLPWVRAWLGLSVLLALLPHAACALTTATVQGTVYRADGGVAQGTLLLSWPAFTTASNEAVASGNMTVTIGADGWVTASLAPNAGASPEGSYYTAVYHLNDGTTSTEYWVVPSSGTTSIASVRARVMPAAMAVQAVSKQYVDITLAGVTSGFVQASGGTMSGPLTLNGDPSTVQQAATKHYVDQAAAADVPLAGGAMTGALVTPMINGKAFAQASTLQQAVTAAGTRGAVEIPASYTGTDTFTNPNGIPVQDLRTAVAQNSRSVKEFGAQCVGPVYADGSLTIGSSIFTLATGFTTSTAMVGRYMVLSGTNTHTIFQSLFVPTVSSIIDSTHLQLSATAPFNMAATGSGQYPTASFWQDDQPGVQAALNWGTSHGAGITFPAGTCWLSKPAIWSGQSMSGQGRQQSFIQGAPAQDVFWNPDPALIDPATGLNYNYPMQQNGHQSDFTVSIDQSVETTLQTGWVTRKRWAGQQSAWANNPTGACWTGVTLGANIGATDTTLTLTSPPTLNQPYFTCGFAQLGAIKIGSEVINYKGVSGSTINILKRGDQGTTAASHLSGAAIVPVNPFDYTNVTDYLPAWQVGNSAFTVDRSDGTIGAGGWFENVMERLLVQGKGGTVESGSGAFVYSASPPYEAKFSENNVTLVPFGFAFPLPAHNTDVALAGQSTMDNAKFTGNNMHVAIPLIAESGCCIDITKDSWYETASENSTDPGPIIEPHGLIVVKMLTGNGSGGGTNLGGWTINTLYQEPNTQRTVANYAGPWTEIGASNNTWINAGLGGGNGTYFGSLLIDGSNNTGTASSYGMNAIVTGSGNTITGNNVFSTVSNINNVSTKPTQYGFRPENFPLLQPPYGNIDETSLQLGYGDPNKTVSSLQDLFHSPADLMSSLGGDRTIGTGYYVDATAPVTGAYTQMPTQLIGHAWSPDIRGRLQSLIAGRSFPATTGTYYTAMKLDAAGSGTIGLLLNCNGTNKTLQNNVLTTSWQIFAYRYDATVANCSSIGSPLQMTFLATTALPIVDFAWEAWVPDFGAINTSSLTVNGAINTSSLIVNGGSPITGTTGTGGNAVLANSPVLNSPVLVTPNIGSATGNSLVLSGPFFAGGTALTPSASGIYADATGSGYSFPQLTFHYAGGSPNQKDWEWYADDGHYYLRALTPGSGVATAMQITGSTLSIASASFPEPLSATTLTSTIGTGTAPIAVTSTTPVTNLTLASATQVPSLPESQITNLTTDLGSKAPLASPSFTTQATAPKFIGVIASETDITFSATPVFPALTNLNYMQLTGNVTSSTLAAGANGQSMTFVLCQDAAGSRTFVWPANVRGGMTIGAAPSTCSSQVFTYVNALTKWVATTPGIPNE